MSGSQQLRLFIQDRLTLAAEEIFGVLEKTISEYEEQVVQSKWEVDQLKQDLLQLNTTQPHIHLYRIDSQPVSEEVLPLQQLNARQELMSSDEDEAVQHHSPQVKEEQTTEFQPVSEEVPPLQQLNPRQELTSGEDEEAVQQLSPQVKEEQVDLSIIPDSENSISNSGTNGFVTSETSSDGQLIPSYTTETAPANHHVTNICNGSGGSGLTFSQTTDDDIFCMEQNICRFCRKQCRSNSDLVEHVEGSHMGRKAFKCPRCDGEFACRDTLAVHYLSHKPHPCPVCGKCFNQRSNFNVHMRTHTGVKPHSCPVCGKLFNDASNLNLHVRTHTGVRPHRCPVCGKMFADRSNLKVHMRIHTGVKPYSCLVCGKLFTQNVNLKVHMRIHTGEKPYFCAKCGKMVTHKTHLKRCTGTHTIIT